MHRRTQILLAAKAALEGTGKPSELGIEIGRVRPADKEELPLLLLTWANDPNTGTTLGAVPREDRKLRLRCLLWGLGADQDLDPYFVWIEKALKADTQLGGLARHLEYVDSTPDLQMWGLPFEAAAIDFDVNYRIHLQDPEA